jgi:Uma2 family endonuclease
MSVELVRRLFSVEDYHRMAEAGILSPDEKVELLEGEVVHMNPIGSPHAACVSRLTELFAQHVRSRALMRVQAPIRVGDQSEPEPDLVLAKRRPDHYASNHPAPQDIFLAIEVAWSSLSVDRHKKMPLYGRFGIPEAWIVNLEEGRLEVYRDPAEDGYRQIWLLGRGKRVQLLAFPEVEVTVDEVLG